jgi:hypothetical protein
MGGYGSGRHGWKIKVEETKRIDIRYLHKRGFLKPGTSTTLSWSIGDESAGSICIHAGDEELTLSYSKRINNEDWIPVRETIELDKTHCNYGGHRTWMVCPRCRRRVAVLCSVNSVFRCRICLRLAYSSQGEGRHDRLLRQARKRRDRMNASHDLSEPVWRKPKGMHWKTFERLKDEADWYSDKALMVIAQKFGIVC